MYYVNNIHTIHITLFFPVWFLIIKFTRHTYLSWVFNASTVFQLIVEAENGIWSIEKLNSALQYINKTYCTATLNSEVVWEYEKEVKWSECLM